MSARVLEAKLRGGGSIISNFKYHWWELHLDCGHVVERRIRWLPEPNAPRGWAALHHAPPLTRLPPKPTRARCEICAAGVSVAETDKP